MENIEVTIGKNIRARRLKLGWTQEYLAELAEMHPVSLNKIEKGGRGSSRKAIAKIAAALRCSVADLHGVEPKQVLPNDLIESMKESMLDAVDRYQQKASVVASPSAEYESDENAKLREEVRSLKARVTKLEQLEEMFLPEGIEILLRADEVLAGMALMAIDPQFSLTDLRDDLIRRAPKTEALPSHQKKRS